MALMHHKGLRVNATAIESDEAMAIVAESGWKPGPHPDTDPDDVMYPPAVLPPKPKPPRTPRS